MRELFTLACRHAATTLGALVVCMKRMTYELYTHMSHELYVHIPVNEATLYFSMQVCSNHVRRACGVYEMWHVVRNSYVSCQYTLRDSCEYIVRVSYEYIVRDSCQCIVH